MTRSRGPSSLWLAAAALGALVAGAAAQDGGAGPPPPVAPQPPAPEPPSAEPREDPVERLRASADGAVGDARAPAFAKLAAALEARGAWIDAATAWREAAAASPTHEAAMGEARALLAFAEEALAAQEPGSAIRAAFEDARVAFAKARAAGVADVAVRIGLARCLAADGRVAEQVAELESAAKDHPDDPAPRRALAFALYHAGRAAEAVEVFRPLSDAAPADAALSLTLSACARAAGDESLALAMAERTIAQHPGDARGWQAVWAIYAPASRWAELADRLAALARDRADDAAASYWSGFAAANAQRWDDALVRLERAWTLHPKYHVARIRAVRILLTQKYDLDRAASLLHEVLADDPRNRDVPDLLYFIATRRSEAGDHAAAAAEFGILATWRPDDPTVRGNFAVALRFAGQYDDSEREYRRGIELAPGDAQLRNDLGLLFLVQGRDDDARAAFRSAVDADPEAKDGAENLGWMAERDARLDEAHSWYREVYARALRRGEDGARYRRNLDMTRFPLPPVGAPRSERLRTGTGGPR